jgi:hypothetical protein
MKSTKLRLARGFLGVIAIALVMSVPQTSLAGGWDDSRPNRIQSINPGSYSPCHWWAPTFYRCRGYHRPACLYDQAEWDGGGSYASGSTGESPSPPPSLPKTIEGKAKSDH